MNYAKIIGWFLLVAGLIVIVLTLLHSYNIFTVKAEAPELFQPEAGVALQTLGGSDIQAQIQEMVSQQLQNTLPAGFIAMIMNLAAWSILAFILIFGGGQISGLGIKLIKKE
ncbi:MAG: hypothetical protein A2Z68_00470 [Candidatus Nealsonbacteria bacterium RBG_13_38_11]|uniref:Uncharacterized protein n=1 Tax=Candidatus Nealsonbacteria bacterium RBG_13_38_11 TaxID=1801662 RepID=A0A1G2DZA8_9BACT|nr:MAG: hypothetical protein A2Z68_00470 [Candidatus Nealsonbacteria bacterium RBG_13_38_11]